MSTRAPRVLFAWTFCSVLAAAQTEAAASRPWPTIFEGTPFPAPPTHFALSPDGATLLTYADDGRLVVGPAGGPARVVAERSGSHSVSIAYSADGAAVGLTTYGSASRTTTLYAAADGRRIEGLRRRTTTSSWGTGSGTDEWLSHPDEAVAARVTGLLPRLSVAGPGGSDAGGVASGATWSVVPGGKIVGVCDATYGGSRTEPFAPFLPHGPFGAPRGPRRHFFSLYENAASRPIAEAVVEGSDDRDAECPVVDAASRSFAVIRGGVVHVGSFDRPDAPPRTFATGARSIARAGDAWYVGTESGALETWRDGEQVARCESSVGPVEAFRVEGRTAALFGRHKCAACVDGAVVAYGLPADDVLVDGAFAVVRERSGDVRIHPDPAAIGLLRTSAPNPLRPNSGAALRAGRLALAHSDGVAVYDLVRGGPPTVFDDRYGSDAFDAAWRDDVLLVRGAGAARLLSCAESRPTLRRCLGDAVWAGDVLCDFGTIADLPRGKLGGIVGASASPTAAARIEGGGLCVVSGPDFAPLRRLLDGNPFLPFAISADGARVVRVNRPGDRPAPPVVECLDVATGESRWTTEMVGTQSIGSLQFEPQSFVVAVHATLPRGEETVVRLDAAGARIGVFPASLPRAAGAGTVACAYDVDGSFAVASDGRTVVSERCEGFPGRKTDALPPAPELPPGCSFDEPRGCVLAAPRGDAFLAARLDVVGTERPRRLRSMLVFGSLRPVPDRGRVFVGTRRDGVRADRAFPVVAPNGDVPMTFVGPDAFAVFDGENVVVRALADLRTLTVLPGPADFLRGSPDGRFLAVFDRGRVRVHRRI